MAAFRLLTLRELAATTPAATSGQDAEVLLQGIGPQGVHIHVRKTAEAAATDLLTVRIQAKIGSLWIDCVPLAVYATGAIATAADVAEGINFGAGARETNIVDATSDGPTFERTAFYDRLPSDILRSIFISSGVGSPSHTFEVFASYFQWQG